MRVFVTGASGFVGSAIVQELLKVGHQVLGLVRSEKGAELVTAFGAEVLNGDVNDIAILQKGAANCDAVIHTAFNHDFSRFKDSCEDDRKVIEALGDALADTGKPLVITSGVGILNYDRLVSEDDVIPGGADVIPRAASEEAANKAAELGAKVYIVRLPPSVHGKGDHGFVPMVIDMASEKGEAAYAGLGDNLWPAVHRLDAAALYRLIVEKQPKLTTFHAVAETGVPFKEIAQTIGKGLNVPVVSKHGELIAEHFGWFTYFATINCPSSSEQTRQALGWESHSPQLLEDMRSCYF